MSAFDSLQVLVIDDEPIPREVLQMILEEEGCQVISAADGEQALELFFEKKDEIQAVVCDFRMPGLNGAEVFNRLRAVRPSIPFVFCSGSDLTSEIAAILSQERTDHVMKPYSIDEILGAVRRVIEC